MTTIGEIKDAIERAEQAGSLGALDHLHRELDARSGRRRSWPSCSAPASRWRTCAGWRSWRRRSRTGRPTTGSRGGTRSLPRTSAAPARIIVGGIQIEVEPGCEGFAAEVASIFADLDARGAAVDAAQSRRDEARNAFERAEDEANNLDATPVQLEAFEMARAALEQSDAALNAVRGDA